MKEHMSSKAERQLRKSMLNDAAGILLEPMGFVICFHPQQSS
ncbi:hypothetical protein [Paenibacillus alkaliterrae]